MQARVLSILSLALSLSFFSAASDTIPLPAGVRAGKLANGFTYFIQRHPVPEKKVFVELVVKAGFRNEPPEQLEFSHLLEHLALGKTKHFNNVWGFLDSAGAKKGIDANGYTMYNNTYYYFALPSGDSIVKRGLLLASDFAHGIIIEPETVNKERGIVLGEIRKSLGADQRLADDFYPKILKRFPGYWKGNTKERIRSITENDVTAPVRFYNDWYRPNLQALIVTGDINVDAVEQYVKLLFDSISNPQPERKIDEKQYVLDNSTNIVIATDEEKTETEIFVINYKYKQTLVTKNDYREQLIERVYQQMMNQKFISLNKQYNTPVIYARHSIQGTVSNISQLFSNMQVDPYRMEEAFKLVYGTLRYAVTQGFTKEEFLKAKQVVLKGAFSDSVIGSAELRANYARHFMDGSAVFTNNTEAGLAAEILKNISINDINKKASTWVKDDNYDVVILSNNKNRYLLPDSLTVSRWIREVASSKTSFVAEKRKLAWNFNELKLRGGNKPFISERNELKELGITELKLSNGVTLVLKPVTTPNKQGEWVRINAIAAIGERKSVLFNQFELSSAAEIVKNGGAGGYNRFDLQEALGGSGVTVDPYIYFNLKGMRGACKAGETEKLLQLIYTFFVDPFVTQQSFNDWYAAKQRIVFSNQNIQSTFTDTIASYIGSTTGAINQLSAEELKKVSIRGAVDAYRFAFGNAAEFTFAVTGNFDTSLIPQLVRYFGALPANKPRSSSAAIPVLFNNKNFRKTIYEGSETERASVEIYFIDSFKYSVIDDILLKLLSSVLGDVTADRLRTKEGGTYDVNSQIGIGIAPGNYYQGSIKFDCSPKDVERLVNAVVEELKGLKTNPNLIHYFSKALSVQKEILNSNNLPEGTDYWLNYISYCISFGLKYDNIILKRRLIENISVEDLKIAIDQFLPVESLMIFKRLPRGFTTP